MNNSCLLGVKEQEKNAKLILVSCLFSYRYKGDGIVSASPEAVWECLKPEAGGLRTKWDQNVKDFELIETISDVSSMKMLRSIVVKFPSHHITPELYCFIMLTLISVHS